MKKMSNTLATLVAAPLFSFPAAAAESEGAILSSGR